MVEEEGKEKSGEEEPKGSPPPLAIPEEILKTLPPDIRKVVSSQTALLMSGRTNLPHPLAGKITSGHIDKFLDNDEKRDIRKADADKSIRRYIFWAFIVALVLSVGLIIALVALNAVNLIHDLIIAAVSLIGGFGSGFGVAWLFKK